MIRRNQEIWSRHLPLNVDPETHKQQAENLVMLPVLAEPADGKAGPEDREAQANLPDTVGNITHDEAWGLDAIRAWRPNR